MGLWTTTNVFVAAGLLRVGMLLYGLYQDETSVMKYTDIDYYVFTDAARYVYQGKSPYERETYRYTPLLAWMLYPTAWGGAFFSFGKILFSLADMLAGYFLILILRSGPRAMNSERALKYASIWLLNPMVATISTRGSSEGILGAMVLGLLWAVVEGRVTLAGILLGVGVHFKIYPFIYGPAIVWYLSAGGTGNFIMRLLNTSTVPVVSWSLRTFIGLNAIMYLIYGDPFVEHTFLYHLTRIDHRHNFSPYNVHLMVASAPAEWRDRTLRFDPHTFHIESLAFIPQLLTAAVILPVVLARKHLPGTMLAQTWAFVAMNKVCTSQYFLWYLTLLPLYLPYSSFLQSPVKGFLALGMWVICQVGWLWRGFLLEFEGINTFIPGLWSWSILFYFTNMYILGVIVSDVGKMDGDIPDEKKEQ